MIVKMKRCRYFHILLLGVLAGCSGTQAAPPFQGIIHDTEGRTRIVVYGDNRCRHPLEFWMKDTTKARHKVAFRIAQVRPDLVINTGDIVDRGGSAGAWRVFDEENAWLRRMGVPYYPVLGNHEFLGGSRSSALKNYFDRFPYLDGRRWYSFETGGVGFVMVDSNFDDMTEKDKTTQLKWIQQTLDTYETVPEIKMSVVVTHHPAFTNSRNEMADVRVMNLVLPLVSGHPKVKVFFSGHSHTYERFRIGGLNYIVTGGGGAPLDPIDGAANFPDDLYQAGGVRGFHYCLMTLYKNQCTIEMFELQPDGSWIAQDSVEIKY